MAIACNPCSLLTLSATTMAHSPSLSGKINNQDSKTNLQKNSPKSPDWPTVCQYLLDRFLPCTAVQTQPGSTVKQPYPIPRSLKIVARGQPPTEGLAYGPMEFLDSFLDHGQEKGKGDRSLVILGESGTGKTCFLQHFAQGLLKRYQEDKGNCLPIWLNPSSLKQTTIKNYLFGPWLEQAAQKNPEVPPAVWRKSLTAGLKAGQFWLVLDGVDQVFSDPEKVSVAQGPLSWLRDCLGELPKTPVLISCHPETHRNDPKGLADFVRYQIRGLTYPDDVETAIEDCFTGALHSRSLRDRQEHDSEDGKKSDLAVSLGQALAKPAVSHLRRYLLNPRRLMLCCRFWRDQPRDLPESSAALYDKLASAFYLWQSEWVETSPGQQKELEQLLGELAKQALLENHGGHRPLPQGDIDKICDRDSSTFRLALQLGWLIPKGVVRKGVWEWGYSFADRTFRDYFAALAIADWQFFLDIYGHHYRIFEPEWQRVMQFWWGRENIKLEQKTEFMQALLDFDDHCSPENFYGLRALERAALALGEIPEVPQGHTVITRLLDYCLPPGESNLPSQKWASGVLEQTHRPLVLQSLLNLLQTTEDERVYHQSCQWLGSWGNQFPEAIEVLNQQLDIHRQSTLRFAIAAALALIDPPAPNGVQTLLDELQGGQEDYSLALQTLSHCAVGNTIVIKALLDLLAQKLSILQHRQILQCLEAVAQDNGLVVASLLQKLRIYPEGSFLCQVAESLEKIDPGNPTALVVLQRHIHIEKPLPLRKQAIYSLGEVSAPSAMVVKSLADLLTVETDIFVRWLIVSSLAKIGQGQERAIATLTDLVEESVAQPRSEEGDWLLNETIQALLKITPHNVSILPSLEHLLENSEENEYLQSWAEILGHLDPGNPIAINTLLTLIRKKEDEYTQRQAANNLAAIDPGNLSALMVLINLLQNSQNENIRLAAAQNLGLVGKNNPAVLAALIRTAVSPKTDGETLRGVVKSLAKIGQNNREVAQTILGLLRQTIDDRLRRDVAQALVAVVTFKLLPTVVYQLREFCRQPPGKNSSADWQIFWHCGQQMTYQDFYQAWHQQPLGGASTIIPGKSSKQRSFFRYSFAQTLQQENPPLKQYQVIWIDTTQFLNLDNPSVDIYDQMLDQHCPEFDGVIPDSLSKLRLYWHQLERKQDHPRILIFEQLDKNPPDLRHFWEQLATFHGAIAILGMAEPPKNLPLPYFQLQESRGTAAAIVAWLQKSLT